MKCEQVLHLDVTDVNTYQYVYAKQGDKNSRVLKVLLFNQGARVLPAVTDQITLRCIKPDQKSCMITGSVDDTGIISVELTDQCLAVPGSVRADITVQNGESVISSVTFFIQVSPMPLNANQALSTNEFLTLMKTLEAAKSATDSAIKAAQSANSASSAATEAAQSVRDDAAAGKFNGVQGPQGEQGPMGATGPQGPKGDKGDTGKDAVIDTTLTHAGQAADAAVVGNRLSALSEEMLTEESDPTVPAWAKEAQKPSYTASEVGADPSGTASAQVTAHNTAEAAHNDIRLLIQGLTGRLNALTAAMPEAYTLPIASSTVLGGVQPVSKTDAMTQSVGVDAAGALWVSPGSSGGGSGLPEGGTPYQYLVTDGDGNAKWEDRLAYETKPVLTEIAPEETITFTPSSGMMSALWPPTFNAVEGSTYIVKFDGTEYECSCIRLGGEGGPLVLGNLSIPEVGDDTGEPFIMIYSGQWSIFSSDSATEHTISISDKQVSLSKIDEKYLPESAFTNAEWTKISNKIVDYKQQSLSLSVSGEQIKIRSGASTSDNKINDKLKFEDGMVYKINGSITFHSPPEAGGTAYTLYVNGNYTCSNGLVKFGSLYESYYKKYIQVGLYSSSSDDTSFYYGNLYVVSALPVSKTYTFDINITVTEEAKPLPDICVCENIQRVGDDVVIPSSTKGSTKKFKITVDDTGAISATEVT